MNDKAYDPGPHPALWLAFIKLDVHVHVPEAAIRLIHSFHKEIKAQVSTGGSILDKVMRSFWGDEETSKVKVMRCRFGWPTWPTYQINQFPREPCLDVFPTLAHPDGQGRDGETRYRRISNI